jgi:hypothetical protein
MHTFNTPQPVALTIRFAGGGLQVLAERRDTTTVEVSPANPSSSADVDHAAATTVEQRGGEIVIIAPDTKRWFGRTPKLDVKVAAPTDSGLTAFVESADVRLRGRLGGVDVNSASGDVRLEHAASLTVSSASGDVWGDSVGGDGRVKTASGDVRLTEVVGTGEVTTASGDIQIQRVNGDVNLRSASGDATVGAVGGSVTAKTASGDIRIDSVTVGSVEIDSASGDLWLGVAPGTAAWLEVQSLSGDVTSELQTSDAPADDAPSVAIRARTLSGDIAIRRAVTH